MYTLLAYYTVLNPSSTMVVSYMAPCLQAGSLRPTPSPSHRLRQGGCVGGAAGQSGAQPLVSYTAEE